MMMKDKKLEKEKFKKFYIYGSASWLLLTVVYFLGKFLTGEYSSQNNSFGFFDGVLNIILIFGMIGIPAIFVLSLFIRLAEFIINKVPTKDKP